MSAVSSEALLHASRANGGPQAQDARPERFPSVALDGSRSTAALAALLGAYRASGGLLRGDDLAKLLEARHLGSYINLARLVGCHKVFGFRWRQTFWVPMFQFDPLDWSVRPGLREVLSELGGVFDSWNLAGWFAEVNAVLDGRRPAEALGDDWTAVLHAAQVCRVSRAR